MVWKVGEMRSGEWCRKEGEGREREKVRVGGLKMRSRDASQRDATSESYCMQSDSPSHRDTPAFVHPASRRERLRIRLEDRRRACCLLERSTPRPWLGDEQQVAEGRYLADRQRGPRAIAPVVLLLVIRRPCPRQLASSSSHSRPPQRSVPASSMEGEVLNTRSDRRRVPTPSSAPPLRARR